jgi:PAS domain S-box-containing protein
VGITIVATLFFRSERCLVLWGIGWVFLIGAGALGPLSALMLLWGSLCYAGRELPRGVIAAALVACLLRGSASVFPDGWLPGIELGTEFPFLAASALVLSGFASRAAAVFPDRVIATGSVALLVMDFFDLAALFDPGMRAAVSSTWVAVGLGVGCTQVAAVSDRRRIESERLSDERELLRRVALIGATSTAPREALSRLTREFDPKRYFTGFGIWLMSADRKHFELLAAHPAPTQWTPALRSPERERPLIARVSESERVIVVGDVQSSAELHPDTRALGLRRFAIAPLRASGELIGMAAFNPRAQGPISDAALRFIGDLSDEIALVLSNAELRDRERSHSAAVAAERSRMRVLVETAPDGILLIAPDGTIQFTNARFLELLGFDSRISVEGIRSGGIVDRIRPLLEPEQLEIIERFRAVVDRPIAGVIEFEMRLRGSRERVLSITARSALNPDGSCAGHVAILHDVTEKSEQAERAQRAQRLEMLGTLAGGIAHEFNNRLTAILGSAQELAGMLEKDLDHDALSDIVTAAERCSEITSGLVAFSPHAAASPRPTEVGATLQQIERLVTPLLGDKIRLEVALEDPGHALADPGALQRVLTNLIVNARDAMPKGGAIRVEARRRSVDGEDLVEITVGDEGAGMDERTQARIFDPFFSTKPSFDGMGLANAHGLVEARGGSLTVQSELGKGSLFRVTWPAVSPPVAAFAPASAVAPRSAARAVGVVLLAEDESSCDDSRSAASNSADSRSSQSAMGKPHSTPTARIATASRRSSSICTCLGSRASRRWSRSARKFPMCPPYS